MFWFSRLILRRNLSALSFDRFPYPDRSFIPHMLNSFPSLHKLSHFDVAADHIVYNKKEFHQVMPEDTVYIASHRETVSHIKSMINYFKVRSKLKSSLQHRFI